MSAKFQCQLDVCIHLKIIKATSHVKFETDDVSMLHSKLSRSISIYNHITKNCMKLITSGKCCYCQLKKLYKRFIFTVSYSLSFKCLEPLDKNKLPSNITYLVYV